MNKIYYFFLVIVLVFIGINMKPNSNEIFINSQKNLISPLSAILEGQIDQS
jgi:hypothetical protein